MSEQKRFENWEEVSCNDCACYWDNSCDGVAKGSQKQCNSFVATRSVVIPGMINTLEKRVNRLELTNFLLYLLFIAHLVIHIFGG